VKVPQPTSEALLASVRACIRNGDRLLDETYDLEFRKPLATTFFVVMIAQEEFAKAFVLYLIREGAVPFTAPVLRAINDHACKQLLGMIMDYVIMHWDEVEELQELVRQDYESGDQLPNDVGSAMEILRYEKIGRWEGNFGAWAEDPDYDRAALHIADGKKDRHKQDALYVRIGRDGRVCSTPDVITDQETKDELERARRYKRFMDSLLAVDERSERYNKIMTTFRLLFGSPE
jgi:AbiV family abortive infection protein